MPSAATARYDWILALCSIAFVFSAFGNGANDVANSYATSVAAQTLTMPVVGVLAFCTEFIGAVALGARVTDTIKNGIIDIRRFDGSPGALMLAMSCAEAANAVWLMTATSLGMPVSTTQTIVGSLIGVGFATQADITWRWTSGSVSQIAASWAIAPGIAAGCAAIIFATLKYGILERKNILKWAFRLLPIYIAGTCLILAAFLAVESTDGFEDFSAGELAGLILGIFFGVLALTPTAFERQSTTLLPGKGDEFVKNYYADAYGNVTAGNNDHKSAVATGALTEASSGETQPHDRRHGSDRDSPMNDEEKTLSEAEKLAAAKREAKHYVPPHERFVGPVQHHSWFRPAKWWGWFKFITLRGVTMDVITHDSDLLRAIHAKANRYDVRVEHMWTYCQVLSTIMMSIAHGSNDVANAVGPWVATYHTYQQGVVATESPTPVWFLVIAGALLGIGFWFYGYHIVRSLGNKITQMSPTRGFAIELGAATTVLLASELGLPVSTTQCLTGAVLGVALMNLDLGAVNWRQLAWIFGKWVLTLPCSASIAGLLCLIALNTPQF
ncbi:hypothetical protein LTR86_004212 [Recurvomyces mirabilis]|nr:hypothetical protein LTR86_004212 [Recurvomyces mirabilis]